MYDGVVVNTVAAFHSCTKPAGRMGIYKTSQPISTHFLEEHIRIRAFALTAKESITMQPSLKTAG